VHEPEDERQPPSPPRRLGDEILHSNICDAEGDHRFDDARWGVDQTERRCSKREAVRDRERRDDGHELADAAARHQQSEQKQQMIVPGENVLDAEHKEGARGVPPRLGCGGGVERVRMLKDELIPARSPLDVGQRSMVRVEIGQDTNLESQTGRHARNGIGEHGLDKWKARLVRPAAGALERRRGCRVVGTHGDALNEIAQNRGPGGVDFLIADRAVQIPIDPQQQIHVVERQPHGRRDAIAANSQMRVTDAQRMRDGDSWQHQQKQRPRETRRAAALVALALALAVPAAGQTHRSPAKTIRAARTADALVVDGILNDSAWQQAEPISDFVQQEPHVNEPATEQTEVRVVIGADSLFFGVTCADSGPVTARERRRDNPLADEDRFEIVLDTFHDHRNGYHFATNPLGTQYDALITDEGRDVNVEWDERWWVETRITETGWTAEIRIPFSTLRSNEKIDTFGVNFLRFTRRTNERVLWTAWDRDFQFLQVSQAGHLTGVGGIETGLKLRVKPYGLGGMRRNVESVNEAERVNDVGLEVAKFSLTPGLTAEVTVNTDFAQTEVDEAVVNLTRFPVFFPEKREFFLERAGIFEFGLGGRRGSPQNDRQLQMYFSRRIGLTEDREPVPIIAGAKLVGRAAGLDVGALSVQTDRFEDLPGSNYTVVRAKRNVLARSNIGGFLSNRQSRAGEYNRVAGGDVTFSLFKNTDVQGFLARSWTPGRTGDSYAGRAKYNWFTDKYELFAEHLYVGPDFQHDIGFVRRTDMQRSNGAAIWQPRPGVLGIRNLVFRSELVYLTDTSGRLETREQIFQTTSRWHSDDALRFNSTAIFDRLDEPFEIAEGVILPPGDYSYREEFVEAEGGGKRMLSGRVRYGWGEFYSGHRQLFRVNPMIKPADVLSIEAAYEFNDVTLPQGAFTTHVLNARANFNPSNRWLTTTLVQYDSASRQQVLYGRLNYIYRPGDDVFVVVNRSKERGTSKPAQYTVLVKMTYSLDF
jgi:hypothetical protein